jgi:hypothetical protein
MLSQFWTILHFIRSTIKLSIYMLKRAFYSTQNSRSILCISMKNMPAIVFSDYSKRVFLCLDQLDKEIAKKWHLADCDVSSLFTLMSY